jgi:hypothetical protein
MIERNRYYEAHESPEAMVLFIAKKVQEVIFGLNKSLLFRIGKPSSTSRYQTTDGSYNENYEWHRVNLMLEKENQSAKKMIESKEKHESPAPPSSPVKQKEKIESDNTDEPPPSKKHKTINSPYQYSNLNHREID